MPYKKQSAQVPAESMSCGPNPVYGATSSEQAGAGSCASEPYQILMPVQMADGRMLPMPSGQSKVQIVSSLRYRSATAFPHAWPSGCCLVMQRVAGVAKFVSTDT